MPIPRPHLAKPVYESLPVLYMLLGGVSIALSYFRLNGLLAALVAIAGILAVTGGAVLALRRRDFRALRGAYAGRDVIPSAEDPPT